MGLYTIEISWVTIYFFIGLLLITSVSIFGSLASRRFNFKYVNLIVASIVIYLFMGFMISKWVTGQATFVACAIMGLFDGMAGARLAIFFKANMDLNENAIKAMKSYKTSLTMAFIGGALGVVGYFIRQIFS